MIPPKWSSARFCREYMSNLLLAEGASSCAECMKPGSKSGTGTARRSVSVQTTTDKTRNHYLSSLLTGSRRKKKDQINNIWAKQYNWAGRSLLFWNAPAGVWSHVDDGTKLRRSLLLSETSPAVTTDRPNHQNYENKNPSYNKALLIIINFVSSYATVLPIV